jgi:hypothetical protein
VAPSRVPSLASGDDTEAAGWGGGDALALVDAAMPSRPDGWEQTSSGVLTPRIPNGGGEVVALGVEAVAGGSGPTRASQRGLD